MARCSRQRWQEAHVAPHAITPTRPSGYILQNGCCNDANITHLVIRAGAGHDLADGNPSCRQITYTPSSYQNTVCHLNRTWLCNLARSNLGLVAIPQDPRTCEVQSGRSPRGAYSPRESQTGISIPFADGLCYTGKTEAIPIGHVML